RRRVRDAAADVERLLLLERLGAEHARGGIVHREVAHLNELAADEVGGDVAEVALREPRRAEAVRERAAQHELLRRLVAESELAGDVGAEVTIVFEPSG